MAFRLMLTIEAVLILTGLTTRSSGGREADFLSFPIAARRPAERER